MNSKLRVNSKSRKGLLVGAAASAAVLILAGSAYACTVYQGKLTLTALTGPGKAGGESSVSAEGKTPGVHEYCTGESRQPIDMNAANQFRLVIAPTSSCPTSSTVPEGNYDVRWITAEDATTTTGYENFVTNCNVAAAKAFTVGTPITVDSNGNYSGGQVFVGTTVGKVNVCVVKEVSTATTPSAPELMLTVV